MTQSTQQPLQAEIVKSSDIPSSLQAVELRVLNQSTGANSSTNSRPIPWLGVVAIAGVLIAIAAGTHAWVSEMARASTQSIKTENAQLEHRLERYQGDRQKLNQVRDEVCP